MSRRSKRKHSREQQRLQARSGSVADPPDQPTQPQVPLKDRWLPAAICVFLGLAVWAVFGQTLHHDFVNLDDPFYVSENPRVLAGLNWPGTEWAFANLRAGFWHPLTWLSLMADAQLYGLHAGGYHLTSVLWHLANTLLLFGLLRQMTGAVWRSAIVAALFGWHPLHVESVAWISERKDVVSTAFWMLTLWAYALYARETAVSKRRIWYGLMLLVFTLGMMAKSMLVTLPVIMLLLDYWPLRRFELQDLRSALPRLLWEKLPLFGLSVVAGLVTVRAEKGVGAMTNMAAPSFLLRGENATLSCVHYLWQTVWPARLAVFYPYAKSYPIHWVLAALLLLAAITAAVLWLGRRLPWLAVGWFWYLITLAPVSGVIQVGSHARADRYTYIPLIGIFLMVVWGLAETAGTGYFRRVAAGLSAGVALAVLLAVAHVQTSYWQDSFTLWTHTLACTSENARACFNLGSALAKQGKLPEAIPYYERAIHIAPDFADAYFNLGIALDETGKFQDAIQSYKQAIEIQPTHLKANFNLGVLLAEEGRLDAAIRRYEQAIEINPDFADAHNNLGIVLAQQGKLDPAIQQYERAIEINPDFAQARACLGSAFATQGRWREAFRQFQQALNLATAQNQPALADAIRARLNSMPPVAPQPQTP